MHTSKSVQVLVSSLLILTLTGCASIVDGRPRKFAVRSQPSDAKVSVFDKKGATVGVQQTPAVFQLKRGAGYFSGAQYRLVIEKEGFQKAEVQVKATVNGWYFGNIVFGGLIGLLIVDPASGAMWTLQPKEVDQVLQTTSAAAVVREQGGLLVVCST